jgi:alginate O-acetyltransferase complex protein AlgI
VKTSNNTVLICLIFFLLSSLSGYFFASKSPLFYKENGATHLLSNNFEYSGSEFEFYLQNDAYKKNIAIDIIVNRPFRYFIDGKEVVKLNCKDEPYPKSCVLSLTSGALQNTVLRIDFARNIGKVIFQNIVTLKKKANTSHNDGKFTLVLLLFVLLTPFFIISHKWKNINLWGLITFSTVSLIYLQPIFTLFLYVLLLGTFYMWRSQHHLIVKLRTPIFFISLSISILFLFKYFSTSLYSIFGNPGNFNLLIPLGISYFIIRIVDTQLKIYRGTLKQLRLRDFLAFILFPATIPAGPIDSIDNFHKNRCKSIDREDLAIGLARVSWGIFQKIVIADFILAGFLFGPDGYLLSVPINEQHNNNLYFYTLILSFIFVYMDFSAYSNIAIGASRILGYRVPENFNFPIFSTSPRDFWKRWHISLSSWCMRNVYFPLLVKTKQFFIPSFMVMLIVGVWHSLTLSWVLWAVHHSFGIYLTGMIENKFKHLKKNINTYVPLRGILIIFCVIFISAGHAFAQYHDPVTAIYMYAQYWASIPFLLFPF